MLLRKAARAIWSHKRSYLACVFLISVGILMYTAMNTAGAGLESSMRGFYRDYRLADVFAKVDAMPMSYAERLLSIEGIAAAEARYVLNTRAESPDSDEIVTLRLISVSPEEQRLNALLVTGGLWSGDRDIIVNPTFFDAHGLRYGDEISILHHGRAVPFAVRATALSPEYVYVIRGETDLFPDAAGFGLGYVTAEGMAALTGLSGVSNDIVLALEEGYTFDDVKVALEDALAPFGLTELIGKEDQLSYAFLELEVTGIRSMAASLPMLFVLLAAIVLYLMMKRVIEQERTQIGTLKAFGYHSAQILAHYLCYGAVTGFVGGLLGCVFGYFLSGFYFSMYLEFFMLPPMAEGFQPMYFINGMLLAVGGGLLGAFMGAWKALRLNPAEAMRPESPKPVRFDLVGRLKVLRYLLTSRGGMALRSITRTPMRSAFVVIGVTFAFGLLTIAGSFDSLIEKMIYSQFTDVQRYEVKLTLNRPLPYGEAVESAYAVRAVTQAEGLLELPVELRHKHLREGVLITGIESGSVLYQISDTNTKERFPPPRGSLILSNAIAAKLHAETGDTLLLSSPLLREDLPITVSGVIEQNLGSACYMELEALSELFDLPKTATSVLLNTDDLPYLKEHLKTASNIASIDDKEGTLQKYRDLMGVYTSMYFIMQVMSAAVAFAIIYNTSTISLSERKREYATLRVLGLSVQEVAGILNFEYWVLGVVGMALGVPFTHYLNWAMARMMETSLYTMPSTIPLPAYLSGVAGCAAAIVLAGYSAKRKIRRFDMVEVLKERE